jgi:hypothetical protein
LVVSVTAILVSQFIMMFPLIWGGSLVREWGTIDAGCIVTTLIVFLVDLAAFCFYVVVTSFVIQDLLASISCETPERKTVAEPEKSQVIEISEVGKFVEQKN